MNFAILSQKQNQLKKKDVQLVIKDKLSDFVDNFYIKLNEYL